MQIVRLVALAVSAVAFTACSNDVAVTSPEARLNVDVAAAPPGTVLVLPGGGPNVFTNGWRGYRDRPVAVGTSSIVTNPSFPGSGFGSLAITNTSSPLGGWEVAAFHSPPGGLAGTRLDAVTRLEYSTYTATQAGVSAILHATLQFTADFDLNDAFTGFEGRLVYEPYHCNATALDTWTTWNTMDGANTGCWFTSRLSVTKNAVTAASACPQANPCTWSEVLTAYPNAGFRLDASVDPSTLLPANRSLILKAGSPWTGTFNADNVSIATSSGVDITYDFEPYDVATAFAECTEDGWMNVTRADGSAFKNQGDCVSYIRNGK